MSLEAKLLVVGGKVSKKVIPLTVPTVIGRGRETGLTVAHPMVSRRHCEVYERDGLLMVRDLASLNGTTVAGQRIREAPLPPDAEFTVGPLTFRAQYEYTGDLSALPDAVLDEREPAKSETPDFRAVETSEVNTLQTGPPAGILDDDFAILNAAADLPAPPPDAVTPPPKTKPQTPAARSQIEEELMNFPADGRL